MAAPVYRRRPPRKPCEAAAINQYWLVIPILAIIAALATAPSAYAQQNIGSIVSTLGRQAQRVAANAQNTVDNALFGDPDTQPRSMPRMPRLARVVGRQRPGGEQSGDIAPVVGADPAVDNAAANAFNNANTNNTTMSCDVACAVVPEHARSCFAKTRRKKSSNDGDDDNDDDDDSHSGRKGRADKACLCTADTLAASDACRKCAPPEDDAEKRLWALDLRDACRRDHLDVVRHALADDTQDDSDREHGGKKPEAKGVGSWNQWVLGGTIAGVAALMVCLGCCIVCLRRRRRRQQAGMVLHKPVIAPHTPTAGDGHYTRRPPRKMSDATRQEKLRMAEQLSSHRHSSVYRISNVMGADAYESFADLATRDLNVVTSAGANGGKRATAAAAPPLPTHAEESPVGTRYRAIHPYEPAYTDELRVSVGDSVIVTNEFSDGWGNAINRRTREQGVVPLVVLGPVE